MAEYLPSAYSVYKWVPSPLLQDKKIKSIYKHLDTLPFEELESSSFLDVGIISRGVEGNRITVTSEATLDTMFGFFSVLSQRSPGLSEMMLWTLQLPCGVSMDWGQS